MSHNEAIGEIVHFSNSIGERLVGSLVLTPGSRDVVVVCHGLRLQRTHRITARIGQALREQGRVGTLLFDFSGNGDSEGSFDMCNYYKEREDLRAAIEFLRQRDLRVVCIVGHSKGGDVVLLYASKYGDVPRVVNVCGRFLMERGFKKHLTDEQFHELEECGHTTMGVDSCGRVLHATRAGLEERLGIDWSVLGKAIQGHVLTIHGTSDTTIPVEDAHDFASVIDHHTLHLVEGAGHMWETEEEIARMTAAVKAFVL